jgi:hypothetical protein
MNGRCARGKKDGWAWLGGAWWSLNGIAFNNQRRSVWRGLSGTRVATGINILDHSDPVSGKLLEVLGKPIRENRTFSVRVPRSCIRLRISQHDSAPRPPFLSSWIGCFCPFLPRSAASPTESFHGRSTLPFGWTPAGAGGGESQAI